MNRLFVFLVACTGILGAQVPKKYPSLLWKISGNGLKKPSYLYGTMHVSHRAAYHLSDQFFDALESAEVVGLETDPGKWLENMEATGELSEISRLRETASSRDFYRQAFAWNFPEKRMLQGIISYDPDIINGLLYRQNKSRENFEESTYIDLFIYQSASKLGKQVISLEDFTQSEFMARLSAVPDEESSGNSANPLQEELVEDAYRRGDLDQLDSISRKSASTNMQRYLIDERNVAFVKTIDSVIRRRVLFSGVGAAHLPGASGVVALLRAKGYVVEPVLPTFSRKSNRRMENLDAQVRKVDFTTQLADDSMYTVQLPGRAFPLVDLGYLKYYIHPDMVNGSFYTIVRLRHLGPMFGVTPEVLKERVDSLLFESVPGRILEKKDIDVNGVRGIEIVNRTRRGDVQHYQIFFTHAEMILFKLGGKGDYATSAESRPFFNSVRFNQKPAPRQVFSPPAKGFEVAIPGPISYMKHGGAIMSGPAEDLFSYQPAEGRCCGVRRAIYNDFDYLEEDTFELNQLSRHVLGQLSLTANIKRTMSTELGYPCLSFSASGVHGNFRGRIYIRGPHYYLVYFLSKNTEDDSDGFFRSFRFVPFKSLHPLKEITDKDMWFTAIDEVTDDALSRFNEAYQRLYERSIRNKDTVKGSDFDGRTAQKHYYSPSSNEFVNLSMEKFNDYDYRDSTEIKKTLLASFKRNSSMVPSCRSEQRIGNRLEYRFRLTDTATVRAIDVRVVYHRGRMLQVDVPCDSTTGPEGWPKVFFNSLTPVDTTIGTQIFENKFTRLLSDLSSADTVKRRQANASLKSGLVMQKSFADQFVKFAASDDFARVNEDSRAQLLVNGGTLGDDRIIPVYTKLHAQYRDSFYLQLCVLKGLACTKTQKGVEAFGRLLLSHPPLVGEERAVSDIFNVLADSLELCRGFFPSFLDLTVYEEYRNPVYALLASMVNARLVSNTSYSARRRKILDDASLALKRYNPSMRSPGNEGQFEHLEKTAREQAENIKGSLDGLANNNFYRGSTYLKTLDASARHPLVNYAFILSPSYRTDPGVREFFSKLSKLRTQSIAMPVAINLLKQDVVINDTLIPFYSRNKFTRAFFFSELEKAKLGERFDKRYLSQHSLIESVLMSQKQLYAFYNSEQDKRMRDSLVLLKEIDAKNKYQQGRLYIYRLVKAKSDEEQWSVVFVEGKGGEVNARIEIIAPEYAVNRAKSEQENIDDLVGRFYLSYRKRSLMTERYE